MATAEQTQYAMSVTVPQAKAYLAVYYAARQAVDSWFANGIGNIVPNDATVILHGDGGFELTGAMIVNLVTRQIELCADMEANDRAKLNTLIQAAGGRA